MNHGTNCPQDTDAAGPLPAHQGYASHAHEYMKASTRVNSDHP